MKVDVAKAHVPGYHHWLIMLDFEDASQHGKLIDILAYCIHDGYFAVS